MSYLLKNSEILDFAVQIERSGYEFYIQALKKFDDAKTVAFFQYLADEEFHHEQVFLKMKEKWEEGKISAPDPEYEAYMKDFCKSHILADKKAVQAKLKTVETFSDVLNMALDFEKDSVVFFTQLKSIVGADKTEPVDRVIQEELTHIRRILEFRKQSGA